MESKYFPYYFSGQRIQQIKSHGGKKELRSHNTVTVKNIILQGVKLIDPKANEWDVEKVRYNEKFWNEYYPIK